MSEPTERTVCHGLWTLTKNLSPLYRFGCLFSEETSLIICESVCGRWWGWGCARGRARACVSVCVCVCVYVQAQGVHVFDNNKASENEEELNCVSHFSFPCSGACQKEKSPAFWMMAQTTKSEQQTPRLWGERWRKRKYGEKKEGGGGKERKRKKEKERRKGANISDKYSF